MIWLTYEQEAEREAVQQLAARLGERLGTARFVMVSRARPGQPMGAGPADLRAGASRIEGEAPGHAARMRREADRLEAGGYGGTGTVTVNDGQGGAGGGGGSAGPQLLGIAIAERQAILNRVSVLARRGAPASEILAALADPDPLGRHNRGGRA